MDHHPDLKEGAMDEVMTDKNAPVDKKETVTPPKNKIRPTDKETRIVYFIAATLLPLFLFSTIYFIVTLHQLSVRLSDLSYYVGSIENRTVSLE
jgi:hypothetical protein